MWTNPQFSADLFTFTKTFRSRKLQSLCSKRRSSHLAIVAVLITLKHDRYTCSSTVMFESKFEHVHLFWRLLFSFKIMKNAGWIRISTYQDTWDKVFKGGPSKICGRQTLKSLKGYGLLIHSNFLKAVFHKFYLSHSWILGLI